MVFGLGLYMNGGGGGGLKVWPAQPRHNFEVAPPPYLRARDLVTNFLPGLAISAIRLRGHSRDNDPHPGCGVVSLSKTLHPHCLVLFKPRKTSQND